MSQDKLIPLGQDSVVPEENQMSERELLVRIVKLQMMLNSKMFEFMRSYQQNHNFGESGMFRDGSRGKTRTGRLMDEVNELGFTLTKAVSAFIGEDLCEKRDDKGRVLAFCRRCQIESPFVKVIDTPYGMSEAYIGDSERLICTVCHEDNIYPGDDRLSKFNSIFRTK